MTLIVAKRDARAIIALGDTKLTRESNAAWQFEDQCNKFIAVSADWILSFAGNFYWAELAINAAVNADTTSFSTLRSICIENTILAVKHGSTIEFLLLNTRTLAMFKVAGGKCTRHEGTAWIGDIDAYAKFQGVFHLGDGQSHPMLEKIPSGPGFDVQAQVIDERRERLQQRMHRAFKALVADRDTDAIGGFVVTLVMDGSNARFWPLLARFLVAPNPAIGATPDRDILFGDAAAGDFNYEVITSNQAQHNFVAVYFRLTERALVFRRWEGGACIGRVVTDLAPTVVEDALAQLCGAHVWRIKVAAKAGNVIEVNSDLPSGAAAARPSARA